MQTLFAISVLCFVGILWAALAFARHIKASQLHSRSPVHSQPDFRHHLFTASEALPRLVPQLLPQLSSPTASHLVPEPSPFASTNRITRHAVLQQSVHDITANKQWTLPRQAIHMERLPIRAVASTPLVAATVRKPPQAARHGRMELLDPAYFNKDMGDLTDPQPNHLRANDRTSSKSSRRF